MEIEEIEYAKIKSEKHLLEKYKEILLELKTNSFTKNVVEENYGKRIIDIYRQYPDFSIVSNLLPVFKAAYKKSFFIYTKRKNNNL